MSTIAHRRLLKRAAKVLTQYADALRDGCTVRQIDGSLKWDDSASESEYLYLTKISGDLLTAAKKIKRPGASR